jgi:hypothetical protein
MVGQCQDDRAQTKADAPVISDLMLRTRIGTLQNGVGSKYSINDELRVVGELLERPTLLLQVIERRPKDRPADRFHAIDLAYWINGCRSFARSLLTAVRALFLGMTALNPPDSIPISAGRMNRAIARTNKLALTQASITVLSPTRSMLNIMGATRKPTPFWYNLPDAVDCLAVYPFSEAQGSTIDQRSPG